MSAMSCSYEFASRDVNATERSFVNPTRVVLVVPDAMVVEPRVGAEYEAVVEIACQAEPLHADIMFVPELKYVAPVISALPWLSKVGADANEPR